MGTQGATMGMRLLLRGRVAMCSIRAYRRKCTRSVHTDSENSMSWATVTGLRQLTPTVTEIVLNVDPQSQLDFGAGQWCDFQAPGIDLLGGYSMTSLPSELPQLSFAVKKAAYPPARWVTQQAVVGDRVQLRVGGQLSDGNARRSLFIAGGIGITP